MKKILIVAICFVITISCEPLPNSNVDFKPGDIRSLVMDNTQMVVVPKTKMVLDRTIELGIAGDDHGIARQVATGEAMLVKQNCKVKVINVGPSSTEVKIQEGGHNGQYGFVPNDFIK